MDLPGLFTKVSHAHVLRVGSTMQYSSRITPADGLFRASSCDSVASQRLWVFYFHQTGGSGRIPERKYPFGARKLQR